MSKSKTAIQIAKEIEALRKMQPHVRHFSMFNDDNWGKIDVQINVLEQNLDEDDVYDRYEDPENRDGTCDIVSNAIEAVHWRDGESEDDSLVDGWKELIIDGWKPEQKKKRKK